MCRTRGEAERRPRQPHPPVARSGGNHAPSVSINGTSGCECQQVFVNGSFSDADGYGSFTLNIDWGDGSSDTIHYPFLPGGTSFNQPHTYQDDGEYTITATVTDSSGAVGTAQAQANIVTVAGVNWVQTAASPLDVNPNPGAGLRIFPDKLLPGEDQATANSRRVVQVSAMLTGPVPNIPVYFKVFDVDDPSANTAPVDDEHILIIADNRGSSGAGPFLATVQTSPPGFEAKWNFNVSMQPGDNFRVVASCSQAALTPLYARQNDGTQARIFEGDTPVTNSHPKVKVTDMLTVWRRLHVEVDSMGVVAGQTVAQKGADPDDDFLDNGEDVPMPDTSSLDAALSEAYVKVLFDIGDNNNNVPFFLNVENNDIADRMDWDSKQANEENFWVAYVLGAFQGPEDEDNDPNMEFGIMGATLSNGGSIVYLEVTRDIGVEWNGAFPADQIDIQVLQRDNVVHEVRHAISDLGGHPVTGLDAKVSEIPIGQTSPDHIHVTHHNPSRYLPAYLAGIRSAPRPRPTS